MNKKELYEKFVKETDQDIEDYHDHKYRDWLEDYVLKLQKQLTIPIVNQQRELLYAVCDELEKATKQLIPPTLKTIVVRKVEADNCG